MIHWLLHDFVGSKCEEALIAVWLKIATPIAIIAIVKGCTGQWQM